MKACVIWLGVDNPDNDRSSPAGRLMVDPA
jgi:hypothetical protein